MASNYEGPTGIVGVLNDAFVRADLDSASLWAAVPHYLAANPNPRAMLALLQRAAALLGDRGGNDGSGGRGGGVPDARWTRRCCAPPSSPATCVVSSRQEINLRCSPTQAPNSSPRSSTSCGRKAASEEALGPRRAGRGNPKQREERVGVEEEVETDHDAAGDLEHVQRPGMTAAVRTDPVLAEGGGPVGDRRDEA